MNTIIKNLCVCTCVALCFSPPIISGNKNPEAQRVLQHMKERTNSNTRIYKIMLDAEQEEAFHKTFKLIEPKPTLEAKKSKKKDIISEALDEGEKDLARYLKENGAGTMNEFDAEYARFYIQYQAWKNEQFNCVYVITIAKKRDKFTILSAVTGFVSHPSQKQEHLEFRTVFTSKQLDSLNWLGTIPGSVSDELKRIIIRMDAEDITTLPTRPSRVQRDEMARSRLAHAVEHNVKDIQIFSIPHEEFQVVHASLTPSNPTMTAEANASRKKDIIMDGIDEGESDIATYIKLNGGSQMNNNDREFEKYYRMLQKYTDGTFESAYIITNKFTSSIEVLGLLLNGICIPPTKIKDCLHNPKRTLLAKECALTTVQSQHCTLLDYLNKLIKKSTCKKVYP